MSQSISDFIKVDADQFAATGAFDAVLEVDSRFFIDPLLLRHTKAPEFSSSHEKVLKRFGDILTLLASAKSPGDAFWREALRRFDFGELKGLCIGYSHGGTSGSGMGIKFGQKILGTAKQMVEAGIKDPAIFGLIGILEEGVGSDRISDMTARIIAADILAYSHRVFQGLGVTGRDVTYGSQSYLLPINPNNRFPILLIPMDILRPLPVARSWDEIEIVCEHNRRLRQRLNVIINGGWRGKKGSPPTRWKKEAIRKTVLSNPAVAQGLLDAYKSGPPPLYDFASDPVGEIRWHHETRRVVRENPLPLSLPPVPPAEAVLDVVIGICEKFKDLVENNGLHSLLYDSDNSPKHEAAAQKVFYGIADSYCEANDLDLSPEMNSGRGYIDFKVSRGYRAKVVVELKLTTNSSLRHGYEVQLAEYQKAERTDASVFMAIKVIGGSDKQLREVTKLREARKIANEAAPELITVDARPKTSASKYVPNGA